LSCTDKNIELAESEAIKISACLDLGIFDWNNYIDFHESEKIKNIGDWVLNFETDYFNRRAKTDKSLLTYKKDYLASFKKLNWNKPLTISAIESAIIASPPDTKVRQRMCMALGALADFANLPVNTSRWRGKYSSSKGASKEIPSDEQIQDTWKQIQADGWRWVFGAIAVYGLRNHEVFKLDFHAIVHDKIAIVHEGKTGYRRIFPIHPEWYELFQINEVILPDVNLNRANDKLGHSVSDAFRKLEIPFNPYRLRHAWAIRSLMIGIDVTLAAQMMGHSVKIHTQTYHRWINEQHYHQAFNQLINREDRPKPPS
jgi:integrase